MNVEFKWMNTLFNDVLIIYIQYSKGNYKNTNIKPTKLQAERMKKRRAKGATT